MAVLGSPTHAAPGGRGDLYAAYQPTATITRPTGSGAWGDGRRRLYPRVPGDGYATVEIAEGETPRVKIEVNTTDTALAAALMAALAGPAVEAV